MAAGRLLVVGARIAAVVATVKRDLDRVQR